jgi:hypothetical protein
MVYRVAPAEDAQHAGGEPGESAQAWTWAAIYRQGPLSRAQLRELLPFDEPTLDGTLEGLERDGRIERMTGPGDALYRSRRILLPLGETAGWEASVLDHYHTVVGAICAKLRNGQTRALPADQLGGSTFSFDVWPGHPHETRVLQLLRSHRESLAALWDEVVKHNAGGKPDSFTRVSFYCGQLVKNEGASPAAEAAET